jgi:hypothetical protein
LTEIVVGMFLSFFLFFFFLARIMHDSLARHTAYDDPTQNPDWGIIWHMIVLIFALIFWHWSIVMAIAYSDTLIVALALTISLFLGDFGYVNLN